MSDRDILKWAAMRSAEQPVMLGFDLNEYRNMHEVSEDDLASLLRCSRDALVCVAFCRRPDPNTPTFRAEVEQIASHCGADSQTLAKILREVDTLRTMRDLPTPVLGQTAQSGLMAAARDRKRRVPKRKQGK